MCRWCSILLGGLLFLPVEFLAANSILHDNARYLVVREAEKELPNYVIAITQTQDGYLWLGTLTGLVRYDGIRATAFGESTAPGLNRIVHLFEDSRGRLWIGTERSGIVLAEQGTVRSLELGEGTSQGQLAAACEDRLGGVWLYTTHGTLWRYFDGRVERFSTGDSENVSSKRRMLIADEKGWIWVGMDSRQFAFDPNQVSSPPDLPVAAEVSVREWPGLEGLLPSRNGGYWRLATNHVQKWSGDRMERDLGRYPWGRTPVHALCEDRQGRLIVGTLGAGLFWFDSQDRATQLSTNQGLSSQYVLSLQVDAEGSLWVGTDGGGLNRITQQVFDLLEETRGWAVQTADEDASGALWIGSIANGLGYWKDGQMERFATGPIINVRSVLVDRDQQVWVGTLNGVFEWRSGFYLPSSGRPQAPQTLDSPVKAIYQDRAGHLWFGTRNGLVRWDHSDWRVFTRDDGLSADDVQALAEDQDGNLWIGTAGGGLNKLRDGTITTFGQAEGLPSTDVSALFVDRQGTLWLGTSGLGLVRFRDGSSTRFTSQEGLSSNFISYLVEDDHGYLWVGSSQGIMRIAKSDLESFSPHSDQLIPVRVYEKPDGLPTQECSNGSQPGVCKTTDGRLWFPTIKGLAFINPAKVRLNPSPPPVVIESVLVDGQPAQTNSLRASPLHTVTLSPRQQRLEIKYTSLNLTAPDRARFKYRLEGHETDWVEVDGLSREVRYNRLPPGQYVFQVTAANEDGVWNETGSRLSVTVQPPFWRTGWFVTVTSLATLGLLIGLVYFFSTQKLHRQVEQFKHQEALEKERARIARDIHDQVGASLTQVALLGELVESDKDCPEEIEAHAQQISRTARETTRALDEIVWTVNPSNDTLDGLVTYVCKYAQEYLAVASLRYRLDVPAQLPSSAIPPDVRHNVFLACKEAITNVVRHAHASEVHLRLRLNNSSFTFEIQDNGRGPGDIAGDRAQTRNGLRNMRKRMEEINGQFDIGSGPEHGTVVHLSAPLRN